MQKRGFTLVELSIVLVIIGLLIGGILVAQSMVEAAKLQNFVRQLQQYDVAVNNFKQKYNSLPGDSMLFGGNGDGIIADNTGVNSYFLGEILAFWKNLSQTELPNTNYDGISYSRIEPGRNCPIVKYAKGATVIALTNVCSPCTNYVFPNGTHTWLVRRELTNGSLLFQANAEPDNSSPLSSMQAFMVDQKIDDGVANAGNVKATSGVNAGLGPTINNSGCVKTDVSQYDSTFEPDVTHCALAIKMLSQTGSE